MGSRGDMRLASIPLFALAILQGAQELVPEGMNDPHAPRGYKFFGQGLADVGDLDGDGRDEFTVSDPEGSDPATIWILSGADTHTVACLSSDDCERMFGNEISGLPDIDDDGVGEIAVTMPPNWDNTAPGRIRIYSGRTRAVLRTIVAPRGVDRFGYGLAGLADVDGDGRADLLVATADASTERCGFLYSGATGRLLREFWRPTWLENPRLCAIGDFDGDGWPDVALTGIDHATQVSVALFHSCRDGRRLGEIRSSNRNPSSFVDALAFGDIDHLGQTDVLLLSHSLVEAFSTELGLPIYSRRSPVFFGGAETVGRGFLGDLDGDGHPDFVLADSDDDFDVGSVACCSGRTGKVLWHEPPWPNWRNVELRHMGQQLAVIGDFDRDGVRDFIWSTDNSMNGSPSLVFVSSGKTGYALKVLARGPNLEILRLGPEE